MTILSGDEFKITKIENIEHVNTLLRPNKLVNRNRFAHAFVYKISGEVNYHFDGITLNFTPGCICYFPKGSDFTIENIILGECIAINFQTEDDLDIPPFCFEASKGSQIRSLFENLETLWSKRHNDFSYAIFSEVYKIADLIHTSMQHNFFDTKTYKTILEIQQYMQENFMDPCLKISDICKDFQCSISSVRKNLNEISGVSPKKYLTSIRINAAKKLLLESTLSISEIAEKSGFDDTFYFSRCFSKFCGCSPSQYRKIHMFL